ncbi:Peptide-N4-(N-acetyl-beta-glucosaminyl)asparagine amidase A [Mycena venus]|uniref:Peptide-N4-(N-acetyl-beta-glucosaminyl)asparagine amidase A n=1 Tax=Mycena venus TaxID=2733690 RepID=A0A8H6TWW6_9AGAR|nr:Peptide-N4-(N-acetyl-beta-glucosaminyl)asparagine amidase A [Mycena venus]
MLPLWFIWAFLFAALTPRGAAVLVDFQVAQPPPVPQDATQCTIQILQRDFAFSFGLAEVVQYTPPTDCGTPGSWAAVTLNFTVTSNGTQLDRLAIFTFQNVESSSTFEPTTAGIIWTYIKDVTRYTPLFAKPGSFILQLDNLIQDNFTGIYTLVRIPIRYWPGPSYMPFLATLHATFYASSKENPPAKQANTIIPLSTLANNTGNDASVPPSFSINVTLPRNAVEVYAELYPSGNGNEEEFWYLGVANEFLGDFPKRDIPPAAEQGPFREVRLLVDGQVAGVAFPYPVIFTGGINAACWRPIAAYGALDLPTYFLDLTPFVPLLTDGKAHLFTIDVVSAETDKTILQNWFVSGLLQVITDVSSKPTTGRITSYSAEPFAQTTTTGGPDILSGSGKANSVVFSQNLEYTNQQLYLNNLSVQNLFQLSSGSVTSTHNNVPAVVDAFSYPYYYQHHLVKRCGEHPVRQLHSQPICNSHFKAFFVINHSYDRTLLPSPFILGSTINERQVAEGFFSFDPTTLIGTGNGTNNNTHASSFSYADIESHNSRPYRFSYNDRAGNTFNRRVDAAFNNITLDEQSGSLSFAPQKYLPASVGDDTFAGARLPLGSGNRRN